MVVIRNSGASARTWSSCRRALPVAACQQGPCKRSHLERRGGFGNGVAPCRGGLCRPAVECRWVHTWTCVNSRVLCLPETDFALFPGWPGSAGRGGLREPGLTGGGGPETCQGARPGLPCLGAGAGGGPPRGS